MDTNKRFDRGILQLAKDEIGLTVKCRYCGAEIGTPCAEKNGEYTDITHGGRDIDAVEARGVSDPTRWHSDWASAMAAARAAGVLK